jgi:hypothetical protein
MKLLYTQGGKILNMKKKSKVIYYILIGLCGCYALFIFIYGIVALIKDINFPLLLVFIMLPVSGLMELPAYKIRKIDKENQQETQQKDKIK